MSEAKRLGSLGRSDVKDRGDWIAPLEWQGRIDYG